MTRPYSGLPDLADIYLEDSWVLDVRATPGVVAFTVEFVLTADHPDYSSARPGEQYCYRVGELRFDGVTQLRWTGQGNPPATDASGERDYGHIDSFDWEPGVYVLHGSWGHLDIAASGVQVQLRGGTPPIG